MNYGKLINRISTMMANGSDVFTRYNRPSAQGKGGVALDGVRFRTPEVRIVVNNYGIRRDTNARIEIISFLENTVVATSDAVSKYIASIDKSYISIDRNEKPGEIGAITTALDHLGLEPKHFFNLVREIKSLANSESPDGNENVIIGASDLLGNKTISLIVQHENMVSLIRISE